MYYYETVYIIHPALQEGRLNDIVTKIQNKLNKLKGEILYVDNWGKKKFTYPIDKQKYGTYILCQYSLDGQHIKDISQELELNPNILRYLITKIDKSDIKEGSTTLETMEEKVKEETEAKKINNDASTIEPKEELENEKDVAGVNKTEKKEAEVVVDESNNK